MVLFVLNEACFIVSIYAHVPVQFFLENCTKLELCSNNIILVVHFIALPFSSTVTHTAKKNYIN